jgi:hypothetical protein
MGRLFECAIAPKSMSREKLETRVKAPSLIIFKPALYRFSSSCAYAFAQNPDHLTESDNNSYVCGV